MKSLDTFPSSSLEGIEYILTDVDDTITTKGKLLPVALEALWKFYDAGYKVICVTGGSAGWADVYLRQWPIFAVVTESGAVSLYREGKNYRKYIHPSIVREGYRQRMEHVMDTVCTQVPGAKLSSDQFARLFDIAFDYGSEPPYLDEKGVSAVVNVCRSLGCNTAVSSIHVNAWFGDYDKYTGTASFFSQILGIGEKEMKARSLYVGDAPNDEVMFRNFPLSFAVGNFKDKASQVTYLPSYLAKAAGGEGFSEISAKICH
ncbi:MAG: haloacid dehalogenase [Spirochaetia bacterium]|jgi:HAD superfamily hydrolase (TIGR01484 family)|nr:haloacid dehalogenase [Spirochaetia bacterium]